MDAPRDRHVFIPDAKMVDRYHRWVDAVVAATWDGWEQAGEVAQSPQRAQEAIEIVKSEWALTDRPEWMHPLDSIAVITSVIGVPIGEARKDVADALRTAAGIGRHGRLKWTAEAMGLSTAAVKRYGPPARPRKPGVDPGRTALYRHFDRFGRLLYVGISNDPDQRFTLHAYTSKWHPHSARRDLEWFDTRQEALASEREAIRAERPMFNLVGSDVEPEDADDYLMFLEIVTESAGRIG